MKLLRLCSSLLLMMLFSTVALGHAEIHLRAPDCGCVDTADLDRADRGHQPFAWNLYSHDSSSSPDALPDACASFCHSKRKSSTHKHFVLEWIPVKTRASARGEERFVCKCYEWQTAKNDGRRL